MRLQTHGVLAFQPLSQFSGRSCPFGRHLLSTSSSSETTEAKPAAPNRATTTSPKELSITCSDGTVLALQQWKSPDTIISQQPQQPQPRQTFLCLHGWMDNCRSFHHLAPALVAQVPNADLFALDLPGHGRSTHKDAPPMVQAELVYYVSEAVNELTTSLVADEVQDETHKITLIGHSLGAGISSLYTAAFPEQIERLILLDGAGFLPRKSKDTAHHVRSHILQRQKHNQKTNTTPRVFPSLELAIKTRMRNARKMPGNQSLSYEAAKELVQRATLEVPNHNDDGDSTTPGVQFQHDPRFAWPSLQYMTWSQVEGIFQAIGHARENKDDKHNLEICILLAQDGWPFPDDHMTSTLELLKPTVFQTLPGSHYFHADPETADPVVDAIVEFVAQTPTNNNNNK